MHLLGVRCNKCGESKDLVFAGCICASGSDALDMQWADSPASSWLLTRYANYRDSPKCRRVSYWTPITPRLKRTGRPTTWRGRGNSYYFVNLRPLGTQSG